ncbi:hypothetical protein [Micromonospora sp. GCM10011541]|uniref:hypothetical protein n=1 Tax=Micromonospora sp. GCM10011541 TaxID=3317336 RepID=UPI00360A56D4
MESSNQGRHYLSMPAPYVRPYVGPRPPEKHHPHLPQRPVWACKVCGDPWPCEPAKLLMLMEYRKHMIALAMYMGTHLHDAVADFMRLHPDTPPDSTELFDRFLAWTNPRQHRT